MSRDNQQFTITRKELRALLFWASIGVRKSSGGSYNDIIESVILDKATELHINIPYCLPYPEWGKDFPKPDKRAKARGG